MADTMKVEIASPADLFGILEWLEREHQHDGRRGFWCNRNVIRGSLESEDLWVIRNRGEAVAFQVGNYSATIVNVRKDKQRQGFGAALFEATLARAIRDDVNVLSGECAPRSSLPFWQKHKFARYGDLSEFGKITVRRVLQREFVVPAKLPRVEVNVAFYPEAATHYRRRAEKIALHNIQAGRHEDGRIQLQQRVIGLKYDEPEGHDLVFQIEIDGVERCFCKAKDYEAQKAGVKLGREGETFFIDTVLPKAN